MSIEKEISAPKILGCNAFPLISYLSLQTESEIVRSIVDDKYQHWYKAKEVAERLLPLFSNNTCELISAIQAVFPPQGSFYTNDDIHHPLKTPVFHMGGNQYIYVREHREEFFQEYRRIMLLLKEEGVIKTRWINEFSLYHLLKHTFPNVEYQKRFDWLGMQSLDIYIPDCNTAIEYQGEQHYRPIDFFGGQESFEETTARDRKKKILCEENGVRLLEWNSKTEVTKQNVDRFIKEYGLRVNPSIMGRDDKKQHDSDTC